MEMLHIPSTVPAMVLENTVFFPDSVLPLFIFEDKYRQMLQDVIDGDRMFAIVRSDPVANMSSTGISENTVTLGCLKACQTHKDGTSTVLLEGICRVHVTGYILDLPYPVLRVSQGCDGQVDPAKLRNLRAQAISLLEEINLHSNIVTDDMLDHLKEINPPQLFVDHATASLIDNANLKHMILNCADPLQRYSNLIGRLKQNLNQIHTLKEILGTPPEDEIQKN